MAQSVSRRPVTAEARVGYQVSPCGICCGHSGTETGLYRLFLSPPVSIVPPLLHSHSFVYQQCRLMLGTDSVAKQHTLEERTILNGTENTSFDTKFTP